MMKDHYTDSDMSNMNIRFNQNISLAENLHNVLQPLKHILVEFNFLRVAMLYACHQITKCSLNMDTYANFSIKSAF